MMNELAPHISGLLNNLYQSLKYFLPEIGISMLFIIIIITDLIYGKRYAYICRLISIVGLVIVFLIDIRQFALLEGGSQFLFGNLLLLHHTAVIFKLILATLTLLVVLYIPLDDRLKHHPGGLSTLYALIIAITLGLHLMVMSVNLLMIYLSIEMVSLGSYILVAYRPENKASAEAGIKYFLFGAMASAIMLYGMSLLYGFSGTLDIFNEQFLNNLHQVNVLSSSMAILMVIVGIGFKLSFVPMHLWTPDIYEGADTPITAYLSALPKVAAFALLINFLTPFIFFGAWTAFDFRLFLSIVAILTMIVGNFAAIFQDNVKRMLAYSAIGHTGFALMALVTFSQQGINSLLFYLVAYALVNIGAFMLASFFANVSGTESVSAYNGLGVRYPFAGTCFVIIVVSLTGLPITIGFAGKILVFSAVFEVYQQTQDPWLMALMITGAVTTVVSLFYYFKIPLHLFLRKNEKALAASQSNLYLQVLIGIIAAFAIIFGIYPDWLSTRLV
ncbi:MAG: NADH-quinone oxidoreductase subunit N [Sphingobacteriaceae bacterium]